MLRVRGVVAVVAAVAVVLLVWQLPSLRRVTSPIVDTSTELPETASHPVQPETSKLAGITYTKTVVMARLEAEDVSWFEEANLNVTQAIYVVDNPSLSPEFAIPINKGHEAMVYLTYIIDHYDNLSDISIFVHAHQHAWHNNNLLGSDMAQMIQHLSVNYVERNGYVNLRCHHEPGCPDWLHLDRPEDELDPSRKMEEKAFSRDVWNELHPGVPAPDAVSQPCCAQFALSRNQIHALPRSEYIRYREWLITTELPDIYSGRVMEYSWQFIFTGAPELCPAMNICYCDGYGVCFGGASEMQAWFDLQAHLKKLRKEVEELTEQDENETEVQGLNARAHKISSQLEKSLAAALERGKDPRLRAEEVGRVWQEGDGY